MLDKEPDFDSFLAYQRARHTSEHAVASLVSELGVLLLTVSLMWNTFDSNQLLTWLGFACIASFTAYWFHRTLTPDNASFSVSRWKFAILITTFFVGFSWGAFPLLFFSYNDIWYLAILVSIYTGYISGALGVNVTFQPSLIAFVSGITIPFASAMFYYDASIYKTIGGLSLFYTASILYVSKNSSTLFIESTRRQYDNETLVKNLAEEKAAVEQAVVAKNRFLASASHDLRQPLNAISLFVEALKPVQEETLRQEIIGKVKRSLNALNGMLHSLLDISKLDAKAIENYPKNINLLTTVKQIFVEYQEKAPHLDFTYHIDHDVSVFIDAHILHRLLRNLIDNAVKYTPTGKITVNATKQLETVIVTIEDTGLGIPEDKLELVFNEYEQLHNPERNREKGLGLGLSIVQRLCLIADVGIRLTSEVDSGTQVRLTLQGGENSNNERVTTSPKSSLAGKFLVVIDDEHDILTAMQHLLSAWKCQVITADTGASLFAKLHQQNRVPDCILCDLRLRDEESGDELIDAIRQEYNMNIPAILITGDTAPDRISLVQQLDVTVLYKPVDPEELYAQLQRL